MMNKFFTTTLASLTVLALSVTLPAFAAAPTDSISAQSKSDPANRPVIGLQYQGPIKAVYQCTRDEWKEGVSKPLLYLKKLRGYYAKQGIDPEQLDLRAVFHGDASAHVLTDEAWNRVKHTDTGNPNTKLLAELKQMGVHVEFCDSRRQKEGWAKADIHPDVMLAEAAFARVIDLQHQGYAYIRF
ncbi:DsrE family protein [Novipirellula maiorica]|nr:DsrE family protein [Rhodopirellula maiorica]